MSVGGTAMMASNQESEVKQANVWEVELDKTGGRTLGIGCKYATQSLEVTDIDGDGLVAEWNSANPEKHISIGDCIVGVNGTEGEDWVLFQELQSTELLRLSILRRPQAAKPEEVPRAARAVPRAAPADSSAPWTQNSIKSFWQRVQGGGGGRGSPGGGVASPSSAA